MRGGGYGEGVGFSFPSVDVFVGESTTKLAPWSHVPPNSNASKWVIALLKSKAKKNTPSFFFFFTYSFHRVFEWEKEA